MTMSRDKIEISREKIYDIVFYMKARLVRRCVVHALNGEQAGRVAGQRPLVSAPYDQSSTPGHFYTFTGVTLAPADSRVSYNNY